MTQKGYILDMERGHLSEICDEKNLLRFKYPGWISPTILVYGRQKESGELINIMEERLLLVEPWFYMNISDFLSHGDVDYILHGWTPIPLTSK